MKTNREKGTANTAGALRVGRKALLAAALATLIPTSAHATDYVLFDAFNNTTTGVAGSGYSFGYTSAGAFGGSLAAFDTAAASGCGGDANIACIYTTPFNETAIYKATINGGEYDQPGSSFYTAGALNFHPGTDGQNSGFQFSAAAGQYNYAIGLSTHDTSGNGSIDYRLFQGSTLLDSGILSGSTISLNGVGTLGGGEAFTLLIGANGSYPYDSTGVSAVFSSIEGVTSAVPEPASWAMMMIGFGGIGGALRRRRGSAKVAIA